jgi:hypothetical protein
MVWDFLNFLIGAVVGAISQLLSSLPQSPFVVSSDVIAGLVVPLGYAAWWFPVVSMGVVMAAWAVVVAAWVTVLTVRQLIEAVTP